MKDWLDWITGKDAPPQPQPQPGAPPVEPPGSSPTLDCQPRAGTTTCILQCVVRWVCLLVCAELSAGPAASPGTFSLLWCTTVAAQTAAVSVTVVQHLGGPVAAQEQAACLQDQAMREMGLFADAAPRPTVGDPDPFALHKLLRFPQHGASLAAAQPSPLHIVITGGAYVSIPLTIPDNTHITVRLAGHKL